MTMRTIECNVCGEPLTAESDDALAGRLLAHHRDVHADTPLEADEARRQVAEDAYSASDN